MQYEAVVVGEPVEFPDGTIELRRVDPDADPVAPSDLAGADVVVATPAVDPALLAPVARTPTAVVGDPLSPEWRRAVIERDHVHHLPVGGELDRWIGTIVRHHDADGTVRELFETVADYTDAAICVYDADGRIRYANPAFAAFEDRSLEELHGTDVWTIATELEADRFGEYWDSFDHGETRTAETTHAVGGGTRVPVEVVTTRATVGGEPVHVSTVRSTSERDRARLEVREQRRQLERLHAVAREMERCDDESAIYDLAADAAEDILELDLCTIGVVRDGRIVLGASTTELPEDGYNEPSVDTDDPNLGVKTIRTGESYLHYDLAEAEEANPAKDWRSGLSVPIGDIGVFQAVSREVGAFDALDRELVELLTAHVATAVDRIRTRESLRESRRQLSTLISNLQGMAYSSEDGTEMTFVSGGCRNLTGHDPETLESTPYDELVHPDDREHRADRVDEALAAGEPFQVEYRIRTVDGETRWVWEQGRGVYEDGTLTSVDGFVTDVTERRQRQRELERQNERLDRFASAVSHDLRNPLTVARGYVDLAAEGDDDAVEEVRVSLERMERIVDDVLELARQGRTIDETEAIDLEPVAREAWGSVETGDLELVVEDATLPADRDRFRRLLENCYRNAGEHADGATTVRVGIDDGTLFVADDGTGLPDDDPDRVFEYGYTTDEEGTGFGLAIVRDVAEAHGWSARATDGEDGGARFEFDLA